MARQLIFIIISYAVFFFLHVQALDCGNRASTVEAQRKCFSDEGLEMDSNKISEVGIIFPLNLAAACRNKENYKQATICAFGIRKQCLKSVGESTSILPDDSSLVEGTDYVCQHVKALEDSCLHTADSGMKECAETKKESQRNYDADSQNIVCSSLQIAYECAQEKLEVCSSETLQTVLDIIDKYFRPPACSPFDNKPKLLTSLPVVSCSSQFSIHQGQEECFTREGIDMYLPQLSTSDQSQYKQGVIESLTHNIDELRKTCRDLSRYQRAVVCATQVTLQCLPAEYRDYIPTAENAKFSVKSICDNVNVINLECMKAVSSRLFDCGYQKGLSYANKGSLTDLLCFAYAANTECLSEVMPTCGCPTTKVYVETSKLYLNAPACSPITVKTPVCDPKTNLKPNLLTSLPVVSCSSQFSIQQGQEECFTREGIDMYLPSVQSQSKQSVIQSYTQNIDELQKICRDLSRYQRAMMCVTQVALQCLPAQYRDYIPTAENSKFMLKSICDNINVTNLECIEEVGTRIYDCGYQKGLSYANKDSITDLLCFAYAANTECLSEVLPTCGCPTAKVYVETSKLYMNAPACSPITVKTPVCDPETNKFLDSAATMLHGMSLLILTALVVCGLYNAM